MTRESSPDREPWSWEQPGKDADENYEHHDTIGDPYSALGEFAIKAFAKVTNRWHKRRYYASTPPEVAQIVTREALDTEHVQVLQQEALTPADILSYMGEHLPKERPE